MIDPSPKVTTERTQKLIVIKNMAVEWERSLINDWL